MISKREKIALLYCAGLLVGGIIWSLISYIESKKIIQEVTLLRIYLFPFWRFFYQADILSGFMGELIKWFQYPIYFLLIGAFWNTKWRKLAIIILIIIHLLVFAACFLPDSFYEYLFW